MAETLGKTVDELLLGRPAPLTAKEATYWAAYFTHRRKIEEEAEKAAKKSNKTAAINEPQFRKTMVK